MVSLALRAHLELLKQSVLYSREDLKGQIEAVPDAWCGFAASNLREVYNLGSKQTGQPEAAGDF